MNTRADVALLKGACDLHCHTGPAMFERLVDDFEAAEQARDAGMRAIVLKDHHDDTSHRAYLVRKKSLSDIGVFGSLVLNYSVGGLNPFAVDVAIKSGAKTIFMPTVDAKNHEDFYGELGQYGPMQLAQEKTSHYRSVKGIKILGDDGELLPEVYTILDLVAKADIILATSHLSSPEVRKLVPEAKKAGVHKMIITHVDFDFVKRTLDEQLDWAKQGAYMEYTYSALSPAWHCIVIEETVHNIRKVGPERCILSSDLGQVHNPVPVEGLRIFNRLLLEHGLTENDIAMMTQKNPSGLLGID
jgi:hypothetical protein